LRKSYLVFAAFGCAGLITMLVFYESANPMAWIDMKVSRGDILEIARDYADARGFVRQGCKEAMRFEHAALSSFYLERVLGVAEAKKYAAGPDFYLWFWTVRFFRPRVKEEFRVWIGPDGRVGSFRRDVPEDLKLDSVPEEEARRLAESFLETTHDIRLGEYEPISSHEEQLRNRVDHSFTWKKREFGIADAEVRIQVNVQGNRVGMYWQGLKIPEEFIRSFRHERSNAWFLGSLASQTSFWASVVAMVGVMLVLVQRRVVRWWPCIILGTVLMLASILNDLNAIPALKVYYPTTSGYYTHFAHRFFSRAMNAFGQIVVIALLAAGAPRIWKYVAPRQDKITGCKEDWLVGTGGAFFRGAMLALALLGYQTAFYLIARHGFDAWTPLACSYSNLYDSILPFMAPLYVGLWAGVDEELTFRLFAIGALLWVFRRRYLAIAIPAIFWAFAHSRYLTSPIYLRGIELTISGVVLALVFLRHDLLTVIVSHYVFNAVLVAMPLLRSDDLSLFASGVVTIALPCVPIGVGLARWHRRKREIELMTGRSVVFRLMGPMALREITPDGGASAETARQLEAALDGDADLVMCGFCDEKVVAVASVKLSADSGAQIGQFHVDPSFRRRYVGTQMWEGLATLLKERGVESISVQTGEGDFAARCFWDFQGFRARRLVLAREL